MVKLLYITANLLKKVPPRQILERNFSHAMSKIRLNHKDAFGRNKKRLEMRIYNKNRCSKSDLE